MFAPNGGFVNKTFTEPSWILCAGFFAPGVRIRQTVSLETDHPRRRYSLPCSSWPRELERDSSQSQRYYERSGQCVS